MTTSSANDDDDPIAQGYTTNAEYWISIVRNAADRYQQELTDPTLLAALGSCAGLDIVDAGCGEGSFTHILARRGAKTVLGIDACLPLIDAARETFTDRRITFVHGDVCALPIPDDSVDVVIANRLPHALDEPHRRFGEFARVLRPGGRLLLMSQHPCFYAVDDVANSEQPAHPVGRYFGRRVVQRPFSVGGKVSPAPSVQPLYSLSAYVSMIVAAGFVVTGLDEPHPSSEQFVDPWWATNFTRPLFMLIQCTLRQHR